MRNAKRNEAFLTLAIIDIDFFKRYNDQLGHPERDLALQKVAEQILTHINRPTDYAFRIGGEEFVVIFSNLETTKSTELEEKVA